MSMSAIVRLSQPRRALRAVALVLGVAALVACGGGGGGGGADPAAQPTDGTVSGLTYSAGAIRGFGSIVVNGVRYDESLASVMDEDGATLSRDALRLGMLVEVLAGDTRTAADGSTSAVASVVRVRDEIEGPLTAITGNTLTVLGQAVVVDAGTVFEDGRTATLVVGRVLEVHGTRDTAGQLVASRIKVEDDADDDFRLRGVVSALDTAARTFRLGDATIFYGNLAATVALGDTVRVRLAPVANAAGQWVATQLRQPTALAPEGAPGNNNAAGPRAELEGVVTRMDSATRFVVDGIVVDVAAVQRLPQGLAVGSLVEVSGRLVQGVLQAQEMELEQRLDRDAGFEVEGRITAVADGSFQVRGVTVDHRASRFVGGPAARLAVGVEVEVTATLSADGSTLVASSVEFD